MYIVYGVESGELLEFNTLKEARNFVKEAQRFDRENGFEGETWTITKE